MIYKHSECLAFLTSTTSSSLLQTRAIEKCWSRSSKEVTEGLTSEATWTWLLNRFDGQRLLMLWVKFTFIQSMALVMADFMLSIFYLYVPTMTYPYVQSKASKNPQHLPKSGVSNCSMRSAMTWRPCSAHSVKVGLAHFSDYCSWWIVWRMAWVLSVMLAWMSLLASSILLISLVYSVFNLSSSYFYLALQSHSSLRHRSLKLSFLNRFWLMLSSFSFDYCCSSYWSSCAQDLKIWSLWVPKSAQ